MSVYSWNAQIIIHQTTVEKKHINNIIMTWEKAPRWAVFVMIFPQNVGTHEFFQEHILRAVGLLTVSSFKML